jgi:nicotinate-nucleotide adenylyltransferase
MNKPKRIGIFGGSFNPVHIGHLIIAEYFVEDLNLDTCFFVPNHISPFKVNDSELISSLHRLEMLNLSIQNNPKFLVDDFEIKKSGVSFTFETILYFKRKYPNDSLFLLMGTDQIANFDQWKNWEIILNNSIIVAARRSIFNGTEKIDTSVFAKYPEKIICLKNPIIEISSTEIRNRIKSGKSIKYLVPPGVQSYIESNRLYI